MANLTKEQKKRLERMEKAVAESGSERLKSIPLEEVAKIKSVPLKKQVKKNEHAKRVRKIIKILKLLFAVFVLLIVLRWIIFLVMHK